MRGITRIVAIGVTLLVGVLAAPSPALAHEEREAVAPVGNGTVPVYRTEGPTLLVCKTDRLDFESRVAGFAEELKAANLALFDQCQASGYRHVQEAVNNVKQPGMIIKILPGVYYEEPSLEDPAGDCATLEAPRADLGYQVLSFEQQVACPHNQNLVAILDKRDLQIEGTGAEPAGRPHRRPVPPTQRGAGRPRVRGVPAQLHRPAHDVQRRLHPRVRRLRDRQAGRALERRVRLPDLRRRSRPLHRLRGLRQRRLRDLPRRGGEHQRRPGPRRRAVRHRDPHVQQPPQPARLLGHGRRLGLGPRQRVHREHGRGGHGQRLPRPPGPAAEPRAVREQRHRRQQRGLLRPRTGRHLRQAAPRSAATRTAWSAPRSGYRSVRAW